MLLITGTQRTGSSLMAEYLRKCGYSFDGDHDEVGAHDDQNISLEYRRILQDETFPWRNYPVTKRPEEVPRLEVLDYEVAKFPFLMMHPALMSIWLSARGSNQDRLLILVREAEAVVRSKTNTQRRAEIFATDSNTLKQTADEMKQNWFDSFALVLHSGIRYHFLMFPDFLRNYDSVFNALRVFGQLKNVPTSKELWEETVNMEKVTAS